MATNIEVDKTVKRKTDEEYETSWNVQFVGDHFVTTTTVLADDEEEAERRAVQLLKDHYGWDMDEVAFDIEAEELL